MTIDPIQVPVSIWSGEDDNFVPASHAEWLTTPRNPKIAWRFHTRGLWRRQYSV